MFTSKDKSCFRLAQNQKRIHTKVQVDGKIVEDKESFLRAWSRHFENLSKSRRVELPPLQELDLHTKDLYSQSCENEDCILDVPFTTEEVYTALKTLRRGKSPGSDSLLAEHLLEGGEAVVNWLAKFSTPSLCLRHSPIP